MKNDRLKRWMPALLMLAVATVVVAAMTEPGQRPATSMSAVTETRPPVGKDSVKFLVLGDNIYGSERPQDFAQKFERPYKPLLDANIPFYASLGNHDDPNQRYYKPFGMGGQRFYTYQKRDVRFYALDSNYMDKDQQTWLDKELRESNAKWKIAYFHHPIYSSGGRHGSEMDLRAIVEPMFIKYGVNVVFSGHEHFYERLKPQKGINYFTSGGAAKLREGDIITGALTAKGFDREQSFMVVEVDGDVMRFQAISRRGKVVDSGEVTRQVKTETKS